MIDPQSNDAPGRLALYATAAAGAVAAAGSQAETTLSPNAPASFTAEAGEGRVDFPFDIDGDGTDDINLEAVPSEGGCSTLNTSSLSPGTVYIEGRGGSEIARADRGYGGLISGSFDGSGSLGSQAIAVGCYGTSTGPGLPFKFDESGVSNSGYLGVRFQRGTGEGTTTHNAVVQFQFEAGSIVSNVVTACYGSEPDEPVDTEECVRLSAGDPAEVPVSRVTVPLSLGLLAVGALAMYRRQRAAA